MEVRPLQLQTVREKFFEEGVTVVQWARERGFSPALVYSVLQGRLRAQRGQAHQIAVALGLKQPTGDGVIFKGDRTM
jgi:gp16 family phage-associated protein